MNEASVDKIIKTVEEFAPLSLQEAWDNSGLQVGDRNAIVTGVLTAVDVTPEVIDEAVRQRANMVISHHPLIFGGLKRLTGDTRTEKSVIGAIKHGIAVYSCHTPLDKTYNGLSWQLARLLGLNPLRPLLPVSPGADAGLGVVCRVDGKISVSECIEKIKEVFPHLRHSAIESRVGARNIAVCTGSGASLINDAIEAKCDVYITGDLKHHDFVDFADRTVLVDCGHFETEKIAKIILKDVVSTAFPGLPVSLSHTDVNPMVTL